MLRQSEIDELIGKPASLAYRTLILAHQNIERCTIFRYTSPPLLQERIEIKEFEKTIIEQALSIRKATKVPFWEAIFSACMKSGECTAALLKATFFHQGQGQSIDYYRRDLESDILVKVTEGNTLNVSLCSEVIDTHEESHHLNFLDFHCEVSKNNTRIVHSVCRELMPQGFLVLDSGDSYHASSLNLMSAEQRIHVLGKSILVSPIIDSIYIAHQLQQSSSSIRISEGGKATKLPTVIDGWSPTSG